MNKHIPQEETGRILAFAIAGWSAMVGWAAAEGVLAKLSPSLIAALGLFALAYAPAMYLLDREVRRFVLAIDFRILAVAVVALDAMLVAAAVAIGGNHGAWIAGLAKFPFALAAFVLAPVAAALHLAAIEAAAHPRVKPASARSPGANPAAT